MHLPRGLSVVFTLDQLLRHGVTSAQVRHGVRRGELRRLRRGAYCRAGDWAGATPEGRHAIEAAAYAMTHRSGPPYVFSHATAAAVLDLPLPTRELSVLHLTVDPSTRLATRRDREVDRQVARMRPADVRIERGVRITSAARTVADCLRRLPPVDAVALADAAVRNERCTTDEIGDVLTWQREWPYAAAGRLALGLVDGRRESALESRSAVVMHQYAIPAPEPQVRIADARGHVVARADFAWLRFGVVAEVDGRVKYAEDAARRVEQEKDRQALLEALGLIVVRWDARHLYGEPPVMVQRLRRAIAAGRPERFRGSAA